MAKKKIGASAYALPSARVPKAVSERAAKAFEEGSAPRLRRVGQGERVTLYLPPELVKQVRLLCVEERRSMSDAATEALTEWRGRRVREKGVGR
jgi:hypothetical protein